MFSSISWEAFFMTVAIMGGAYYFIALVLLYSDEIAAIFRQMRLNRTIPLSQTDQTETNDTNPIMGEVRYAAQGTDDVPREDVVEADEFSVAGQGNDDEPITVISTAESVLIEAVSNLLEEIKALHEVSGETREEAAPLFEALFSHYPQLAGTASRGAINKAILDLFKEHTVFQIELSEIDAWWPEPVTLSNSDQPQEK